MTLGEQILKYRAKHDLSQSEFADKAKVSLQTIYSIEKETQKPGKLTTEKIMLVLNGDEDDETECNKAETV